MCVPRSISKGDMPGSVAVVRAALRYMVCIPALSVSRLALKTQVSRVSRSYLANTCETDWGRGSWRKGDAQCVRSGKGQGSPRALSALSKRRTQAGVAWVKRALPPPFVIWVASPLALFLGVRACPFATRLLYHDVVALPSLRPRLGHERRAIGICERANITTTGAAVIDERLRSGIKTGGPVRSGICLLRCTS